MTRPDWRSSDYLCPDCARRLESTTGPGGINCQECPNCEWSASYDPDADEHPSNELERARLATDGGEEVGRAIAQNASLDDSLTFGDADPTITSLEDVHLDSTLVLVGCGASKRDPEDPTDRHLATVPEGEDVPGYGSGPAWPAEDLYTSTYFAVKREFAEVVTAWANSRDATPWAVLSAEHGILPHWQDVPRYDTTIDHLGDDPENPDHHVDSSIVRCRPDGREIVTETDLWATNVAYGLARWLSGYRDRGDEALTSRVNSLLVLAGQDYIEPLRERGVFKYGISRMAGDPNENLAELDADVRFLFEEIDAEGIGEQMGWLSDTVDTLEPLVNDVEETEQDTLVTDGGEEVGRGDHHCPDCGAEMRCTHDSYTDVSGGETWECPDCGTEQVVTFDGGGTAVSSRDLYEFPMHNDSAVCTECGTEIEVPDVDDPNGDMKPPHWRREQRFDPFNDVFHALCDECYADEVSRIIDGGEDSDE